MPHPKSPDGSKRHNAVTIHFNERELAILKAKAEADDRSMASYIRTIVKRDAEKHETARDE